MSGTRAVLKEIDSQAWQKCNDCEEWKPLARGFFPLRTRSATGLDQRCNLCTNQRKREYDAAHKDRISETRRELRLKKPLTPEQKRQKVEESTVRFLKKHGLDWEKYFSMLGEQSNVCAISGCGRTNGTRRMDIDHDHSCCPGTGSSCDLCIRGLLCGLCNRAMGCLDDDVSRVLGLIEYIKGGSRILTEAMELLVQRPELFDKQYPSLRYTSSFRRHHSSPQLYDAIMIVQDHTCAIKGCGRTNSTRRMDTDHNHNCCDRVGSCGECIRGLLCHGCNKALGALNEDPIRISGIAEYIIMGGFQYE